MKAVTAESLKDPEVAARFGPSLIALADKKFPEPFFTNQLTVDRLGYAPIGLDEALRLSVAWLREHDFVPAETA